RRPRPTDVRREFPSLTALVLVAAAFYGFYRVREALTPFVLAAAFAYVLNPVITYFEAKGLRRSHLVIAGYLCAILLGALAYAGIKTLIVGEANELSANAPTYFAQLKKVAVSQEAKLTRDLPLPPQVAARVLDTGVSAAMERLQSLPSNVLLLVPFLAHALLVPFIGFFFLLDGPGGFENMIQTMPSRYVEQAIHLMGEIDTALGNYLRGIIIVAFAIALASYVGLFLLGVDNAFAIAALSGI